MYLCLCWSTVRFLMPTLNFAALMWQNVENIKGNKYFFNVLYISKVKWLLCLKQIIKPAPQAV